MNVVVSPRDPAAQACAGTSLPPGLAFASKAATGPIAGQGQVFTPKALQLLLTLQRRYGATRQALLARRGERQRALDAGQRPDFLAETAAIRAADWRVASIPADLQDRRVEITGPVDRKMIINALNAPVQCFMADFEDSTSPTWENLVRGQINLRDAVSRSIRHDEPNGKSYRLGDKLATLIVRPRGWHLEEKHVLIDGAPISASLFDFAIFLANNHEQLRHNGSGPYFYLPKMESHLEARLWNEVFVTAQEELGLPRGTIKATVLIETILAAFEMDEILYELREHIVGLNCGRWDYIFSFIKKFRTDPAFVLPDRSEVTMERHFLKSYVQLLIQTCHRRGAHAMGGMAAQIPIRGDDAANDAAMQKVHADKTREARAGHDGTWIAHPGLADIARSAFDAVFQGANQVTTPRASVTIRAADLLAVPEGKITETGLRHNIRVGVQYVEAWLRGTGCVPLYHLMEDAATAEISRAQLWQWIHHACSTDDGVPITAQRFARLLDEELARIHRELGPQRVANGVFPSAARLFAAMVLSEEFDEFLTLPAYQLLD
jgi:malate synthase